MPKREGPMWCFQTISISVWPFALIISALCSPPDSNPKAGSPQIVWHGSPGKSKPLRSTPVAELVTGVDQTYLPLPRPNFNFCEWALRTSILVASYPSFYSGQFPFFKFNNYSLFTTNFITQNQFLYSHTPCSIQRSIHTQSQISSYWQYWIYLVIRSNITIITLTYLSNQP